MKNFLLFIFFLFLSSNLFSQFRIDTVKYTKDSSNYKIEVNYPKMSGYMIEESQTTFNNEMDKYASEIIKYYKELILDIPDELFAPYDLYSDFDVLETDNSYISILFSDYMYTGGAHGITHLSTFNFDLMKNKKLLFDDIYKENYLNAISEYCISELMKMDYADEEWIKEGAAPIQDNYAVYNFIKEGVLITFSQYQVAPYAVGTPQVLVPYSILKKFEK